MDDLKLYEIQDLYLQTEGGVFNVVAVNLSLTVGGLPNCIVSLSTGGLLNSKLPNSTALDGPSFPQLDEACNLFIKINNTPYLLMSGFLAGEQSSLSTIQNNISSRRSYRIASVVEKIDSVPPMAVRYLSNAVGANQLAQHNFILVSSAVDIAKSKAKKIANDVKNLGKTIIECMSELQSSISQKMVDEFSKYIKYNKIQLQLKNPPTDLLTYIVTHLSEAIMKGASYFSALLSLCADLHLSLIPKYKSGELAMYITHVNPWSAPKITLTPTQYSSMEVINMSRKSSNVDGIIISNSGDTTSTATHLYTFYGQYKGKDGAVHKITKDTLTETPQTTAFKFSLRSIPGWLLNFDKTKDTATNDTDLIERLCKEFFAQEALTGQQVIVTLPIIKFLELQNTLGSTYAITTLDKTAINLSTAGATDKLFAFLRGIQLNIMFTATQINANASMTFSHVRTPEIQNALSLKDSELLYSVQDEISNTEKPTEIPEIFSTSGHQNGYQEY